MKKFEYMAFGTVEDKWIYNDKEYTYVNDIIKAIGLDGWELVSVCVYGQYRLYQTYYFKREIIG